MQSLDYPVILSNDLGASAFSNKKRFTLCGEEWVDQNKMIGSLVIGSSGNVFRIKKVQKTGSANLFPKWLVKPERRIVRVDYELEHIDTITLDELKSRMKTLFKSTTSPNDVGLVDEIDSAETILNVIESVGID